MENFLNLNGQSKHHCQLCHVTVFFAIFAYNSHIGVDAGCFPNLLGFKKRIWWVLLECVFQGLVNSLAWFLRVRVLHAAPLSLHKILRGSWT